MAFGSSSNRAGGPRLVREDAAPEAREPGPDRSHESWGAWGADQVAQPEPEKPLLDTLEVAGAAQRDARAEASNSAAPDDRPVGLSNPTSRDFRVEPQDTDDALMASEPPRNG
jgi:hypothetical protein